MTGWMILVLMLCINTRVYGITCYSCDDITHPRECGRIKMCSGTDVCYVQARRYASGQVSFTSDCINSANCSVILGKRHDQVFCKFCCNENFCNRDLCDVRDYSHNNIRCISCKSVEHPSNCTAVEECADNQVISFFPKTCADELKICATQEFNMLGYKRYRLGCVETSHCALQNMAPLIGKRIAQECAQCCSSDHCNSQLCTGINTAVHQPTLFLRPLPVDLNTCHDADNITCGTLPALHPDLCQSSQFLTLCPKSCGICETYGWSTWDAWGTCPVSCGSGLKQRTRTCLKLLVAATNKVTCPGNATDFEACNTTPCPINGQWSLWGNWGVCSHTCDNGFQVRHRSCTNPVPQHGGQPCTGDDNAYRLCNDRHCPVDGHWSDWGAWGTCSTICYGGQQTRHRSCSDPSPAYNGKYCRGGEEEIRSCGEDCRPPSHGCGTYPDINCPG